MSTIMHALLHSLLNMDAIRPAALSSCLLDLSATMGCNLEFRVTINLTALSCFCQGVLKRQ